jgi:Rad3-related DNA helicase
MLSYFTHKYQPRPQQREVLESLEQGWDRYDVFIVRAPVATGKSSCAEAVAKWAIAERNLSTTICTPTNVLVKQYLDSCDGLTAAPYRAGHSDSSWATARNAFKSADIKICNYYTYLALRAYSPILIVDESHRLLPMLTELDGVKLWKHLTGYPDYMPTILHFLQWAEGNSKPAVKKAFDKISAHPSLYTMSHEIADYRGKDCELVNVHPLSPKNSKPVLWPGCVKKLILMSATIGPDDIVELGLDRRRVKLIDVSSPIPPERRPIVYDPIGSMSMYKQAENLPKLVTYIEDKMDYFPDKGLLHVTYALSSKLRATRLIDSDRIIWHNSHDKAQKLKQWLASPPSEGKVLMACGLTEGLDVKGDLGRWQIICKCLFPDKSDIAVAEKMRNNPDWYIWQCVKEIEQAVGRICRSEDDYGITFIADSAFARLYEEHKDKFSISFNEALE